MKTFGEYVTTFPFAARALSNALGASDAAEAFKRSVRGAEPRRVVMRAS
jgi:hypothetical protein